MMSDGNAFVKQIFTKHAPSGRSMDVKKLLHLVEDSLRTLSLNPEDMLEDMLTQDGTAADLSPLSELHVLTQISNEISYKEVEDPHTITVAIFELLQEYQWDQKLVLTLAAAASSSGTFWLLEHGKATHEPIAEALLKLKGFHSTSIEVKPRFDALNNLLKVTLELTKCLVQLKYDIPDQYITQEVSELDIFYIPTAVYWGVRGCVFCATQTRRLTTRGIDNEVRLSTEWEQSTVTHKLKTILDYLRNQLDSCYKNMEKIMDDEYYESLCELFKMPPVDNMRVLKALLNAKDDVLPLVDGSTKNRANLEVLRRKNVLLLISGLDIFQDELFILEQIYKDSWIHGTRLEAPYELVWIPIVDRQDIDLTETMKRRFERLQEGMPWYSVYHPSLIGKAVIRFMRTEWKYRNKPILVVLDPQGRVACPNAIHMMCIWGSRAFPFTSSREEALWREETWRLELLVNGIDPVILDWINYGKYILLYGGDDIEWVQKFVREAHKVAQAALLPLEMVYVGKSHKREQVQRVLNSILVEKLNTHSWKEQSMIWFFWTRLESIFFSKIQLRQANDHDNVMHGIKRLLSYDKQGGWFLLARGPHILVNGHANTGLQTLMEYETLWREIAEKEGFDAAFEQHNRKLHEVTKPCCQFDFSHAVGRIPEKMKCPECPHNMHVHTTFQCCHEHDEGVDESFYASTVDQPSI